jgi:hypothetical protein
MKQVKMNVRFKKGKRSTGLARIGEGTPSIKIIVNGCECGYIAFNDGRFENGSGIAVRIQIKRKPEEITASDPCTWKWIYLKARYETEEKARTAVKEIIVPHYISELWLENRK